MADAYGHLRLWRCEEVGVGESDVVWALLGYFFPRPVARPDRRFRSTRAIYFGRGVLCHHNGVDAR